MIENMSPFTCEAGVRHAPFGEGGGERVARELGVDLLGQIPLNEDPDMLQGPLRASGEALAALAARLLDELAPRDLSGCSARLLERVEAALADSA